MILKEFQFIKDGEIDETEIGKFIDLIVEGEEWKPVLKKVISECRSSVKGRMPEIIKKVGAEVSKECSPEPGSIVVCVVMKTFQVNYLYFSQHFEDNFKVFSFF